MNLLDFKKGLPASNELIGSFGEWLTKYYSKIVTDALILHDVLIDGKEGYTSQIDLIMVGVHGICVVEVKSFPDAKIYGDYKKSKWYYYRGGKKYEIYSPVKQNEKHVKYLKAFLGDFGDIPVFSIITMLCDDFKISSMSGDINISHMVVCNSLPAMTQGLKIIAENTPIVFDETKKQEIYNYILNTQYSGKEMRQKHKEDTQNYQKIVKETESQKVCPYCKTPLILRKGKYGEFYGCGNYPKCKYTLKV